MLEDGRYFKQLKNCHISAIPTWPFQYLKIIWTSKYRHLELYLSNTRGSAIAERPARRSVLVEIFYCCKNNANKLSVSLRSTLGNCHVLFRYLHCVVHVSFNYRTASTECRGCHHQTSVPVHNRTTNHVDVNWIVSVIIGFRLSSELNVDDTACSSASAPSWTRTTVADGHKVLAVRRLRRRLQEQKCNFYLPHMHFAPPLGWFHWNFVYIYCIIKLQNPWVIVQRCLRDPTCSGFGTTPAYDRQTDRRTDRRTRDDNQYRASIASRGQ